MFGAASRVLFEVRVQGRPAPQGSKNSRVTKAGKAVMYESSAYVKPWREAVRWSAVQALRYGGGAGFPLTSPLSVDVVFSLGRGAGHYGTGRNAGRLRASAPPYPSGPPDLSKLARATEDALTTAGVWRDDALVVAYGRLAKVYVDSPDPDALHVPGAVIRIRSLT